MASLRQIRRRMRSIENINDITKAMEMIAAFRFKKAENRFSRTRAYLTEMETIVANLARSGKELKDPLFEKRKAAKKTLVVLTGDKGLCGAYNANLLRAATHWLGEHPGASVVPVGKIGSEFFRKRHANVSRTYPEKAAADLTLAKAAAAELKALFLSGQTDSVELLYTVYRAGSVGTIHFEPFLGLDYLRGKEGAAQETDTIFEPDFEGVFAPLLSAYLEGKMYRTLLESLTSEYMARMIAMKQASENGEEVLDKLKLLRNKTRQATITRELTEIVSGANALA